MPTLVISAPRELANANNWRSFDTTMRTGIGSGYAIASALIGRISVGDRVVLLSKDEGLRAEGRIAALLPTEKAGNGIQRYDVHMADLRKVPYAPESLNRNGVAVL